MTQSNEASLSLLKAKRTDIFKIDPRAIIVDEGFNVRQDYGDIESLMNSILENGIEIPLKGYRGEGGMIHLTDGYRRNRAVQMAIEKGFIDVEKQEYRIPMLFEERGYRPEDRIVDMFVTQDNKPLEPIEICEVFYRLHHKFGMSQTDIAKKVGKSLSYVTDMLKLASSDIEIRNEVKEGNISAGAALSVIKETEREVKEMNNGTPANEISNELAVNRVKTAVQKAKAKGKKKASAKDASVKSKQSVRLRELVKVVKKEPECAMIVDCIQEIIEYIDDKKKSPEEIIQQFIAICAVYGK